MFTFLLLSLLLFCVPLGKRDHCTPIAFIVLRARCSSDQLSADLPNNGEFQCLKEVPFRRKAVVHKKNHLHLAVKVIRKSKKTCLHRL